MRKFKSGIYEILNICNKKRYIGGSVDLSQRKRQHFYMLRHNEHKNLALQADYNLHGEDAFRFVVIRRVAKERLKETEQRFLDVVKPEYNKCTIVGSSLGVKRTEETKERIRAATIGNTSAVGSVRTEEYKINVSKRNKGFKHTEEAKKKISAASKRQWQDESYRQKILRNLGVQELRGVVLE